MSEPFSWLSLDTNEEIVWSGTPRLHVVLWLAVPALSIPTVMIVVWPTLLGLLVGVLAWVSLTFLGYVYTTNIEYVVSTKYVYSKWGVLGRSVTQVSLHNIQDTTLSQGIFGTYSEYGTVSFSTAGGDGATLAFYLVDEPRAVKSEVDRQVTAARKRKTGTEEHSKADGVAELLSEVRSMRESAQRIAQGHQRGEDHS